MKIGSLRTSLEDSQKVVRWTDQARAVGSHAATAFKHIHRVSLSPRREKAALDESPISLNGEMVRAILSGKKSETRSLVKTNRQGGNGCPPGEVGELLWVRERFATIKSAYKEQWAYAADDAMPIGEVGPWTMSLHMPRRASRILLRVTDVRIEHLQDMTDADALAQGCPSHRHRDPLEWFINLWDRMAPEGARWADNPRVWAVKFEPAHRRNFIPSMLIEPAMSDSF